MTAKRSFWTRRSHGHQLLTFVNLHRSPMLTSHRCQNTVRPLVFWLWFHKLGIRSWAALLRNDSLVSHPRQFTPEKYSQGLILSYADPGFRRSIQLQTNSRRLKYYRVLNSTTTFDRLPIRFTLDFPVVCPAHAYLSKSIWPKPIAKFQFPQKIFLGHPLLRFRVHSHVFRIKKPKPNLNNEVPRGFALMFVCNDDILIVSITKTEHL